LCKWCGVRFWVDFAAVGLCWASSDLVVSMTRLSGKSNHGKVVARPPVQEDTGNGALGVRREA
jgi:hypothetical protein